MVERTGSLGERRPLESMRWDAKIVLIKVDLPKPVCPAQIERQLLKLPSRNSNLTNAYDIELKAPLQQFLLDLLRDAIKTHVALGYQRPLIG